MPKAQAANGRLAVVKESSYGVNPGTGFQYTRFTSEGLKHDISLTESQEVRAGRNPLGAIRTNVLGRGPINFEAHLDTLFKSLLQAVMCAATPTDVDLSARSIDISASAGQTCTMTDAATANAFANIAVGQWFRVAGFTSAANNGYVRCTGKTSNNVIAVEGRTFSNEAGQTDIAIEGTRLVIGSTANSFTIEKQFTDVGVYQLFLGALINTFSLNMRSREIVTGSMEWWSKFPTTSGSSGAGTPAAASTLRPANAIDNVINVREGTMASVSTHKATEITFEFNNNLQDLPAIGVLGPDEIGLGSVSAQGRMSLYLADVSMANKIENATETMISWQLSWPNNVSAIFTLPAVDLGEFESVIQGRQGAIAQNIGFFPKEDANGVAVQIDLFGV
jgi:hypothetical protein